jgi:hypothetical protein
VLGAAAAVALVAPIFTSPLVAPRNELADRYWFIGSAAAALVVGWAASSASARRVPLAVAALIASLSLSSYKASSVWASEVDLWTFVVQISPSSPRAWSALSRVHRLADQGDLAEAAVERSLALRPEYTPALISRMFNHLWFGRLEAAREQLRVLESREGVRDAALQLARRCLTASDARAVQACVQNATPLGMVLGDVERLRAVSERMLSELGAPAAPAGGRRGDDPAARVVADTFIVPPESGALQKADAGSRAAAQ